MDSQDKGLWYREYKQGRRFFVKVRPGEHLVESITRLAVEEGIRNAAVLSAIGSVKHVHMNDIKSGAKLPITSARLTFHELEGPFELLGLSGNIVRGEDGAPSCHLHIIVSKSSGDVVGGHMQEAEVFATCEIVLVELLVEGVERHLSKSGGTSTIYFSED